jgi:hypothetical protein
MTSALRLRALTRGLMGIAAVLIELASPNGARAAIAQGPKYTNSVAAEEQRIIQFFQAEQSFQDKLKVGRERYEQKQLVRSNIIAGMNAELQARQQSVANVQVTAANKKADELVSGSQPWLAVTSLVMGIVGLACFLNRQRPQAEFVRKQYDRAGSSRSPGLGPNRAGASRGAAQVTKQSTKNKSVLDLGTRDNMTLSDGEKPSPSKQLIKSATLP